MINCKICGIVNDKELCDECLSALEEKDKKIYLLEEFSKCPFCEQTKKELQDNFCRYCGASFKQKCPSCLQEIFISFERKVCFKCFAELEICPTCYRYYYKKQYESCENEYCPTNKNKRGQ